ncbi:MAG: EAL domain-containing protein [Campylobacterota bacterium]|nr:EAL domain-containing protein [Campylobacterota bacterium]
MNSTSITFRITALLIFVSLMFIVAISFVTTKIVQNSYEEMEINKLNLILQNIKDPLSLSMMYEHNNGVKDIAEDLLKDEKVLHVKVIENSNSKPHTYSKNSKSEDELISSGNFHNHISLSDPMSEDSIGVLSIIYSNKEFLKLTTTFQNFMIVLFVVATVFIMIFARYIYINLFPLKNLAIELSKFDPKNPKPLEFEYLKKDEIEQIAVAASDMVDDIIEHNNSLHELNSKLMQRELHLRDAQRLAHVGSWEYDVIENSFEMSVEMKRILGIDSLHVVDGFKEFAARVIEKDRAHFNILIDESIESASTFQISHQMIHSNTKLVDIHTQGKVYKKEDGSIKLSAVSMDVTDWNESQKTIEKLAYYDSLTQLPNRVLLKDRLKESLKESNRYNYLTALLFLDLDHFKLINDTLGHDVGDMLLKDIALKLSECTRDVDTVSRIGGDEFLVLLPHFKREEDVLIVAQKIIDEVSKPCFIGSHKLYVTASIGVAMYPKDAFSSDLMIKNADIAMYDAKSKGRNNYSLYDNSMSAKVSEQMHLEIDMREALKSGEEFVVYYQPQVDLKQNRIISLEALIRWNHPTDGLLFPDTFIPFCESTGLIIDLGNHVIESVIKQISIWEKSSKNVSNVAINLSGRQFQHDGLVEFIKKSIDKYEIDPSHLEFEITESISMANIQQSLKIMHELKALGASLSIDDFGTGYSSLAYLKQFPVDTLKIDKSFVLEMIDDNENLTLVKTMISMGHSLGMKIVAEGAEGIEHIKKLSAFECDIAQGYHYSKAIKIDELNELITRFNK